MSDVLIIVAIFYVAVYSYLSVKCIIDGILPNGVVYPLAVLALFVRPDAIAVVPLDHLAAGLIVFLFSYFLYTRRIVNAGLAKVAATVALASPPEVVLPALGATFLFCVGSVILLAAARVVRPERSMPYGAIFPLAGIHSVLWMYFPIVAVVGADVVLYAAALVGMVGPRMRALTPPETLGTAANGASASNAGQPMRAAETAGNSTESVQPAVEQRIGDLLSILTGTRLNDAPGASRAAGALADASGPAVVLAKRGLWLQVRDIAGNVGWLTHDRRVRIVIVDDVDEIRENLGKLIGFETDMRVVGLATDGEEGVRIIQAELPDIVLMDINMPVMDGITATEILTKTVPNTKVIMMSLQDSQDYIRRSMVAGAKEYLVEPFATDDLISTIRRVASS